MKYHDRDCVCISLIIPKSLTRTNIIIRIIGLTSYCNNVKRAPIFCYFQAIRTLPGDELLVENGTVFNVSYSVIFAWTFPPYRRRGLASRLLFHLRVQLAGPGEEPIGFNQIAFSDPSPDLHRFVKGLTESETYLVAI